MNLAQIQDPEVLKQKLIDQLDISSYSPELQDKIISDLVDILMERITLAFLTHIPQQEVERFNIMLDSGDQEQLAELLKQYVPNPQEIADQIIQDTINEYKQLKSQYTSEQSQADTSYNADTFAGAATMVGATTAEQTQNAQNQTLSAQEMEQLSKEFDEILNQLEQTQHLDTPKQSADVSNANSYPATNSTQESLNAPTAAESLNKDIQQLSAELQQDIQQDLQAFQQGADSADLQQPTSSDPAAQDSAQTGQNLPEQESVQSIENQDLQTQNSLDEDIERQLNEQLTPGPSQDQAQPQPAEQQSVNKGQETQDPIQAAKDAAKSMIDAPEDVEFENFVVTDDGVAQPVDSNSLINPDK